VCWGRKGLVREGSISGLSHSIVTVRPNFQENLRNYNFHSTYIRKGKMNDLLCIIPLNENVVFKGNNYEKVRN
jgi:hypothetical protein